jgi:hypothetical protein
MSRRNRRCLSSALENDLMMIPEFKEAQISLATHPRIAIPLLQRAKDISRMALGSNPEYEFMVATQMSYGHRFLGNFKEAEDILNSCQINDDNPILILKRLQMSSMCRLLAGDTASALNTAQIALDFSDQASKASTIETHDMMYKTYGVYGLCKFFAGEIDESEDYLHTSSRWAGGTDDIIARAISSCNIGITMNPLNASSYTRTFLV